ncbi:MAG: cyclopropane-fatty-acyl-phospholipid synthase family protein [Kofleriaceae bacterium]
MTLVARALTAVVDRGLAPTPVLRAGIRAVCAQRLRHERRGGPAAIAARQAALLDELARAPIAVATDAANAQHYEVPAAFYRLVLGPHLKYSGGYWPAGTTTLGDSEAAMLALAAERAGLADGQDILDLGCGWGAMALWAAARYPAARVVGLSNSASQRASIEATAAARGLTNLRVVTGDINTVAAPGQFDRIVSVEMFEHVRNHRALFARVAGWLRPAGAMFVHVFAHRELAYLYEDAGPTDWMTREFFTGGIMPSADLLLRSQDALVAEATWQLDGTHYARTSEAWLANLDRHRDEVIALFGGGAAGRRQYHRWRVFFLACAELFGYRGGAEWIVAHYRFVHR